MRGKQGPAPRGGAGQHTVDAHDDLLSMTAAAAAAAPGDDRGEGGGGEPAAGRQARDGVRGAQAIVRVCRSARLTPAAYAFYRAILLAFVELGHAPEPAIVAALARRFGVRREATLARMAAQDLLQRDPQTGRIRAAYPFSGVPTPHRVALF